VTVALAIPVFLILAVVGGVLFFSAADIARYRRIRRM
jgi:hypothetical protein